MWHPKMLLAGPALFLRIMPAPYGTVGIESGSIVAVDAAAPELKESMMRSKGLVLS